MRKLPVLALVTAEPTTGDEVVVEGRRTAKARSEEAGYPGTTSRVSA